MSTVTGEVTAVKVDETKKEGTYKMGILLGGKWYTHFTQYPDQVRKGNNISFDVEEKEYQGKVFHNVAYGSLKKLKSEGGVREVQAITKSSQTASKASSEAMVLLTNIEKILKEHSKLLLDLKTIVMGREMDPEELPQESQSTTKSDSDFIDDPCPF